MSTHKNQQPASSKAASRQPKGTLYLLRGDKITDDPLGDVVDALIVANVTGQAKSPQK